MSYLLAPAVKMLAIRCVVCNRSLLDAKSAELGIGPDCRKKYGFDVEVPEAARKEGNKLIHALALGPVAGAAAVDIASSLIVACARLAELGFTKLAKTLAERKAPITIKEIDASHLLADLPYNEDAIPFLRRLGRAQYDANKFKGWLIHTDCKRGLYDVMQRYYPGQIGSGKLGMFVVAPLTTKS